MAFRKTHVPPPASLELDSREMRQMVELATDRVVKHLATLGDQPTHANAGGKALARALREKVPERGVSFDRLLRLLFGRVIPTSLNTASPGYLGYIPGGGLFHAAVADFIAAATNRYVGIWRAAPGLVQIEANAVAWCREMIGMPESAFGILTSGGSISNLVATVTARHERFGQTFEKGVAYASDQVHHSALKALAIAGIRHVRVLEADDRFRLDSKVLSRAIAEDRRSGLLPFLIVASAGTTNTGAIDPLAELADVAEREGVHLHVDAAYGGFFALTDRGRLALDGLARADTVTLDPHKSLFLPYGTGCLLAKDPGALKRAHAMSASYLPPSEADPEHVDFSDLGPELSRAARGLRLWLPLKMHGASAFRAALDEKIDLARAAATAISALPDVEIVAAPELSLFAFRLAPPKLSHEEADAFSKRVLAGVNARRRVFITGATVKERFVLRVCVLSFRTHADRIEMLIEDVARAIAEARS
jgi:aromatic-L-amino-acid decarboxylase